MSLALMSSALLAFSGMLSLCLGLERHYRQLLQRVPVTTRLHALRILGWTALAGGFATSVANWGWAMGPVGWLGLMSLAGLALVMLSPYALRLLMALLGIGWLLLGLLALIAG
ncbi:DUF3325 domain-containing protein [Pseudomonas sp. v388]|uniref:DUF3325 domain-containing protein n=1 Tax=Pseudomonas sp. v388 TaxID=2479849 RepID=UPI000F79F154|nr:DUF3325 domain-containing protein [Pseudomonas sp. v388]RRV10709.1 DUF3325 domain-containing protein [Pseudomonas sp. v388]